jgi:phosphomannomutase
MSPAPASTPAERALAWADDDPDAASASELRALVEQGNEAELAERMAGPLAFGTAGLRGVLGAGESRMNRAVVARAAAGIAAHLLRSGSAAGGVVIGYDARHMSREFADETAAVLAGAGIVAHVFTETRPTPLLAFAVTELGAAAGVMVTASHNPPAYNGYKVYAANGAQIVPPDDESIAAAMAALPSARGVARKSEAEARRAGLRGDVGPELVDRYLDRVAALSRDPRGRARVRIAYTPLHGVGYVSARAALARFGFDDVHAVPEQREPDPAFPTTPFPNPEERGALDLCLALARRVDASLVLANDPDADRLAVAVPVGGGAFRQLTGNEVGALLGEYVLRHEPTGGPTPLAVTTIVSSPLLGRIAAGLGASYAEVFTGFKWITNVAMRREATGRERFAFGYEEALGYAIGGVVRDKDGLSAAALFAELVAVAAVEGRSVPDELDRLARTYGAYESAQVSLVKTGLAGVEAIGAHMRALRGARPARLGGLKVEGVRDFLAGAADAAGMPPGDVLAFDLEGGARFVARPSGTEPKLKLYFDARADVSGAEGVVGARARAGALVAAMRAEVLGLLGEGP